MKTWEEKVYEPKKGCFAYISRGGFAMNNPGIITGNKSALAVDSMSGVALTSAFYSEVKDKIGTIPVKFFLYTHGDSDHVLAAHVYDEAVRIATSKVGEKLSAGHIPSQKYSPCDLTGAKITMPDIYYHKKLVLDLGGRKAEILELGNCHSQSDSIVYVPDAGVVYCGDILYTQELPELHTSNVPNWIRALDFLLTFDADTFIPGHGPIGTRDDIRLLKELLQLFWQETKKGFDSGMTPLEIYKNMDLGEVYEQYREQYRRITAVDVIYRTLQGKDPCATVAEWDINAAIDELRHKHGDYEEHFRIPSTVKS